MVTYWQVFLHTKWIKHTSYTKQDQRRCNDSNITISRLLYDGKVHNCTGCASAHTRLEFRRDISLCLWPAVARRKVSLTSACVYRASVFCRSTISRSQFYISCPYICSGWVFRGGCVYLADPWGHTFSDNNVFSFCLRRLLRISSRFFQSKNRTGTCLGLVPLIGPICGPLRCPTCQ